MTHIPRRVAGIIALFVLALAYEAESASPIHRLFVPAVMALAAWMVVQNVAAVSLAIVVLSGVHSDPGEGDWITGGVYPLVCVLAGCVLGLVIARRFHARMVSTRAERWRNRKSTGQPP